MLIQFFFLFLFSCALAEDACFRKLKWYTKNGDLVFNQKNVFTLKGLNWWGMQSPKAVPHGLNYRYNHNIGFYLDFMKQHDFNAIRFGFSARMVLENTPVGGVSCQFNPDICQDKALDLLEKIIDQSAERGILIMLDFHTLGFYEAADLWYNDGYSEAKVLEVWDILLKRFGSKWNLFALDLSNEPHGIVRWGNGDLATDWRLGATRIIKYIGEKHPNFTGLFLVEGRCCGTGRGRWFDVEFPETEIQTGDPKLDKRVVYSPHHYRPGRDKVPQEPFVPMTETWERVFGRIEESTGHAAVFGEWGEVDVTSEGPGKDWAEAFVTWLQKKCMADTFYWSLNGGTKALLRGERFDEPVEGLIELVAKLQPHPSKVRKEGRQICVTPGTPVCQKVDIIY